MASVVRKVEISYEGMGTCIEATVKLGGAAVCVIGSPNVQGNKVTDEIVMLAKNYLIKKEKERVKNKEAGQ